VQVYSCILKNISRFIFYLSTQIVLRESKQRRKEKDSNIYKMLQSFGEKNTKLAAAYQDPAAS
jgi:hypothetical protein